MTPKKRTRPVTKLSGRRSVREAQCNCDIPVVGLSTAVLLACAVTVWLASGSAGSPAPARTRAFAPPTRAFATCPRSELPERKLIDADHNPRAAHSIVPMTPTEVQLCRYWRTGFSLNPKSQSGAGKLARERVVPGPGLIRPLALEFHDLRMNPRHGTGMFHCPADEGATLEAIFRYTSEPDVPVEVRLSGCLFASNGRRVAYAGPIVEKLEELIPPAD